MVERVSDRAGAYHHGDLRRVLLDVALTVLEREGPERLSLREVSRAAGVSQSAPYNHFDGKQDLLAAVATAGFHELAASQALAAAGAPTDERLLAMAQDYVRAAVAQPQRYRLMFGTGIADRSVHAGLRAARAASAGPLEGFLVRRLYGDAEPDPERVSSTLVAVWSLVHGLAMLVVDGSLAPDKHPDVEVTVRRAVATLLAGLDGRVHSAAVIPPSTKTSEPLR